MTTCLPIGIVFSYTFTLIRQHMQEEGVISPLDSQPTCLPLTSALNYKQVDHDSYVSALSYRQSVCLIDTRIVS